MRYALSRRFGKAVLGALTVCIVVYTSGCAEAPPLDQKTNAPEPLTRDLVSSDPVKIDPISVIAPELQDFAKNMPTVGASTELIGPLRMFMNSQKVEVPPGAKNLEIESRFGAPPIEVWLYDPLPDATNKPAYLHMHGGGYVIGNASSDVAWMPNIAQICKCLIVSVDYRLAPETTFPGPLEDNMSALMWLKDSSDELGVDPARIAIGGVSAGGGHAAQLAIAARDRGIPILFQVLIEPMLDDRTGSSLSVPDHIGHYVWNVESNQFGWSSYLGQPAGIESAPYGAVPARLESFSGLPPAWIGVGSADLFMTESILYAKELSDAGVLVELIISPGGFHGFSEIAKDTQIAIRFRESWSSALYRALHE